MNRYMCWLLNEVELWKNQGLISAEQAREISALYPLEDEPAWGRIIFAAIGAIVFGLGVILLFAYNWEAMHRYSKLLSVIVALAGTHAAAFYLSRENSAHKKIGESLHLLGTMFFGAGIWLVAQIYHIDEHYPNAMLVWALGALAFAWVYNSVAHSLLALVLLVVWHGMEVFGFDSSNLAAIWLFGFGLGPLVWMQRSRMGLFGTSALLLFVYCGSYIGHADNAEETMVAVLYALCSSYVLLSFIASKSRFPESADILRLTSVSVFALALFICSFSGVDELHFRPPLTEIEGTIWFYFLLPLVLMLTLAALVFTRYLKAAHDRIDLAELAIYLFATVFAYIAAFGAIAKESWIIYAILFPVYAILLIYRGTVYLRWQSTALGSILLAAYTVARFMDLFDSLLLRALAFLLAGALLFFVGLYYSRQKQKARLQTTMSDFQVELNSNVE